MRVRTCGLAALALGILIGAGGCTSSESPTAPMAPSHPSAGKGGVPANSQPDTTVTTITRGGGYIGVGQ
jgi:hypothetical protein